MNELKKQRMTISMSEENREVFNRLLNYFSNQYDTETLNYSNISNRIFSIFEELFIKESKTDNLSERLNQLKRIKDKNSSDINNQLTLLKNQNDLLTYIILAMSQKMDLNFQVEWKPEFLQSMYTGTDPNQNMMMKKALELIQKDRARGQTIKSTNRNKNGK